MASQGTCIALIPQSKATRTGTTTGVWALPQVCTLVRHEVLPILPKISDLVFDLSGFSHDALKTWLRSMGAEKISQTRSILMSGHGPCATVDFATGNDVRIHRCRRSVKLHLKEPSGSFPDTDDFRTDEWYQWHVLHYEELCDMIQAF